MGNLRYDAAPVNRLGMIVGLQKRQTSPGQPSFIGRIDLARYRHVDDLNEDALLFARIRWCFELIHFLASAGMRLSLCIERIRI